MGRKKKAQFKEPTRTYSYALPLRPDINVSISGVPFDLTRREARRIQAMIKELVLPEFDEDKAQEGDTRSSE